MSDRWDECPLELPAAEEMLRRLAVADDNPLLVLNVYPQVAATLGGLTVGVRALIQVFFDANFPNNRPGPDSGAVYDLLLTRLFDLVRVFTDDAETLAIARRVLASEAHM